jgi:hypothetical protein
MNLQSAFKLILASSVAVCCAFAADAQTVSTEFTGTVDSLQGAGWASSVIGNSVTIDFAFDAGAQSNSFSNEFYWVSAPITSASIVSGVLGSGINLESGGPGTGTFMDTFNLSTGSVTTNVVTSADAPSGGYTGDVFGLSFLSDGIHTASEVVRNAYENGIPDPRESGVAFLSNVNIVPVSQAPEIDPASSVGALTLLLGGLAVIRGKKFAEAPSA